MEKSCKTCLCNTCIFEHICCDSYQCDKEGYRGGEFKSDHKKECDEYIQKDKNSLIGKIVWIYSADFEKLNLPYDQFQRFNEFFDIKDSTFRGVVVEKSYDLYRVVSDYGLGHCPVYEMGYTIYLTKEELNKIKLL